MKYSVGQKLRNKNTGKFWVIVYLGQRCYGVILDGPIKVRHVIHFDRIEDYEEVTNG